MYGAAVTPNMHKLALQFGVLDNFFDSGEVSGDGHVWSTAAIGTDYLEKTWQQTYRGSQRTYDYEGVVADGYPLLQKIPDVNEPASGYLWGNLAAHGKTYYHFGEFISTIFCDEPAAADPQLGQMLLGPQCARKADSAGRSAAGGVGRRRKQVAVGDSADRDEYGDEAGACRAFAPEAPDFNLLVPDQVRVDIFLRHLKGWIADKQRGNDTMPNFVMLRLPNDHTAGTRPGGPTPKAQLRTTIWRWGARSRRSRTRRSGTTRRSSSLKTTRRMAADHVDAHRSRAGDQQVCAARRRRRAVRRQPVLLDGERGAHDGDAAGFAADEQQRCVQLADRERCLRGRAISRLDGRLRRTATTG